MELKCALGQINRRLAGEGHPLRVEQRGQKLNLRGRLPDRRNPEVERVQRLSLGLTADSEGLRDAEHALRQVQRQLQRRQFNWDDWSTERSHGSPPTWRGPFNPLSKLSSQTPVVAATRPAAAPPGAALTGPI